MELALCKPSGIPCRHNRDQFHDMKSVDLAGGGLKVYDPPMQETDWYLLWTIKALFKSIK